MHLIVRLSGLRLVVVATISPLLKEAPRKVGADLGKLGHTSWTKVRLKLDNIRKEASLLLMTMTMTTTTTEH